MSKIEDVIFSIPCTYAITRDTWFLLIINKDQLDSGTIHFTWKYE